MCGTFWIYLVIVVVVAAGNEDRNKIIGDNIDNFDYHTIHGCTAFCMFGRSSCRLVRSFAKLQAPPLDDAFTREKKCPRKI